MDNYKQIAGLIKDVISSKISVQNALIDFPKDNNDINIKCAFDALMHYEADEDIRSKDSEYAQLQDDYLEYIAHVLDKGENIAKDVIARYYKYHESNILPGKEKGFCGFLKYIKRVINF